MSSPPLSDVPGPDAIVAVPVRNEEERIAACLRAIDAQEGAESGRVGCESAARAVSASRLFMHRL